MMVFTSIYGVVDGFFVSNYVGKNSFAAINLIMPFLMIIGGMGFMIGTGGSALTAKTLGEGDSKRANAYFTMMVKFTVILGIILSVFGIVFIRPIAHFLGADSERTGAAPPAGRASELGHCRGAVHRTVRRCEGGAVPADGNPAG